MEITFVIWFATYALVCEVTGLNYETVRTKSGPITGFLSKRSKNFLGIPYAKAKRFSSPERVERWQRPLNATKISPMCYQNCPSSPVHVCQDKMSEDCLHLNIYRPLENPVQGSKFAVMVFIHGGNFMAYSGGSKLYNGEAFASEGNVILVTFNYRLGVFGFLAIVRNARVVSGNYGLKDQRMALQWVHENIEYFGGDPQKVTLFGQSAGAQSIAIHQMSDQVSSYFTRVIMQSNPLTIPFREPSEASTQTRIFSESLRCSVGDFACYRSKDGHEILKAMKKTAAHKISRRFLIEFEYWGPVIDGQDVPSSLMDAFGKGEYRPKDMIIGTNSEEGVAYAYSIWKFSIPTPFYKIALKFIIPKLSSEVAELYPISGDASTKDVLAQFITDLVFYCPSRYVAEKMARRDKNVWLYLFDEPLSSPAWGEMSFCNHRVCHGTELPFLFNTAFQFGFKPTETDDDLSSEMIGYWSSFAKYGNPNHGGGRVPWPLFQTSHRAPELGIVLREPIGRVTTTKNWHKPQCDFWDRQGYINPLKTK